MSARFQVLVVDTAHRCLGPMTEALLRAALARVPGGGSIEPVSAGTRPLPGLDQNAVFELTRRGATVPEASAPRVVTREDVCASGLVLAADPRHRARAVELDPSALRRAFCMTEFAALITHCGWPGPRGVPTTDLADLVDHAVGARGLVAPNARGRTGLADPDGLSSRRVRLVARTVARLADDLADGLAQHAANDGDVRVL